MRNFPVDDIMSLDIIRAEVRIGYYAIGISLVGHRRRMDADRNYGKADDYSNRG